MTNPYSEILQRLIPPGYTGGLYHALIDFCLIESPRFEANPRPFEALNPFAAILELGMPSNLAHQRRLIEFVENLANGRANEC